MSGPISFTVKPPSAPHRPSPLGNGGYRSGPPSRRMFESGHDDEDNEDERSHHRREGRREERVEGFRNGRSHGEPKDEPLVIPSLPNRDWRQTVQRRTPSFRPEERKQDGEMITHERTGDGPQRSGIRIPVRTEMQTNGESSTTPTAVSAADESDAGSVVRSEPLSLEQQALAEILAGGHHTETEEERAQRELVIAMSEGKDMTEEEAYRRDVDTLPEESTLEDYAAIPVSAFGLAMVRGMGYDPKSEKGTVVHEPKIRPQLLGLGATPMDPSIRPTHSKHGSKSAKERQEERRTKTGRGFNAANLLVKQEREGSSSSITPSGSTLASPNGSERRRRREEGDRDYDTGREVKRERNDEDQASSRDRDRDRDRRHQRVYETEEERSERKARERRDRDRDREYETDEERAARRARERRERDRDYETEEERMRRKERERRDRDRYDDRERDRYRDDRDRRRDHH
ncbi:DExH-box splicing factor binding site-domain-containing protein [Kockovaella imperatae]|uniref:DExH-box splicing factor binding site-domain-containing protein n=1 Tax=Kockovaella imperatae TaxID=4999 RepID=A0A1Y1USK1_9TREE|nr:DExH-box splicing factor binding site-domain-containing protein [Kockovaella imperatae]ORX40981.1 DExH-box splicing factor binding site-domain-containing protein [Kockovaella imperatae]